MLDKTIGPQMAKITVGNWKGGNILHRIMWHPSPLKSQNFAWNDQKIVQIFMNLGEMATIRVDKEKTILNKESWKMPLESVKMKKLKIGLRNVWPKRA